MYHAAKRCDRAFTSCSFLRKLACVPQCWCTLTTVPSRAYLPAVSRCGMAVASQLIHCEALQWVLKTAQWLTSTQLPTIGNIYHKHCQGRAKSIIKDASQPNHGLFTLLPFGRKSFFPETVTAELQTTVLRMIALITALSPYTHCLFLHMLNLSC